MKQWLVAEAQDVEAIRSAFDQQPGVKVKDQFSYSDGVLGLVEADTSQFPLSRLDETITTPKIIGISVYRDEQHARNIAKRLTGK
ncbi:MAG: hypothetical protein M3P18_19400 [Actinomycetota bacterium]|nr:hypothetical protein [Actinomycetota bacterium]